MGRARITMDRLTAAATMSRDLKVLGECYAENAVAHTPDQGEIRGRDNIVEYWRQFVEGFSDTGFETMKAYEAGDTAIDEGWFTGTHTGPLPGPTGEAIPATGKKVRMRGVDFATVDNDGLITEYRLYFDQMDFLGQLGLLPEELS